MERSRGLWRRRWSEGEEERAGVGFPVWRNRGGIYRRCWEGGEWVVESNAGGAEADDVAGAEEAGPGRGRAAPVLAMGKSSSGMNSPDSSP